MSHMITAKADDRRRVQIPDIKSGTVFSIENDGSGTIILHEIKPVAKEPVFVKPVKQKNGLYLIPLKLDRKEILASLRADRERK